MTTLALRNEILNSGNLNEEATIYAKKIDGKFSRASKAVVIELSEEEQAMKTYEISELKCPGLPNFVENY